MRSVLPWKGTGRTLRRSPTRPGTCEKRRVSRWPLTRPHPYAAPAGAKASGLRPPGQPSAPGSPSAGGARWFCCLNLASGTSGRFHTRWSLRTTDAVERSPSAWGCVSAPSPTCQEISFSFPGRLPMERVLKTAANTLPLLVSRASPGPAAPGGERRAERAPCLPLAPGSPPATRVPRPPAEAPMETHLSREVFLPTRGCAPCPSPATPPPTARSRRRQVPSFLMPGNLAPVSLPPCGVRPGTRWDLGVSAPSLPGQRPLRPGSGLIRNRLEGT